MWTIRENTNTWIINITNISTTLRKSNLKFYTCEISSGVYRNLIS